MKGICFTDVDGVFNYELFYAPRNYKEVKKQLRKDVKSEKIERLEYYKSQIDTEKLQMFSLMVNDLDLGVVISSTWKHSGSIQELQEMFDYCGGTFKILDVTGSCECRHRGCEVKQWLVDNCEKYFGVHYFDFFDWVIIDDDRDFLLEQANHFFWVDSYAGLTPNICNRIDHFFTHKMFKDR